MQKNEYKVYVIREKATNLIRYVGITRQSLAVRFSGHIHRKKIKRIDYDIELITDGLTVEAAAELEKMLIQQYNTLVDGWNISPGSINGFSNYHSEQHKQKWRSERFGSKVSEEHAEKNRIARLGQTNSEEHRSKISAGVSRPVMCVESGITYSSARQAAKELNLHYCRISEVCNGKRHTTGNLHFVFVKKK